MMREKTKKEIKGLIREVLKEEKLVGSGGGLWLYSLWDRNRDAYVEGVVSKLNRMEDSVKKLEDLTKSDTYEYVDTEKKLRKKKKPVVEEDDD